jgi:NADPH:quinone reductase-like Zn-dependent oxidoreductase
VFAGAPGRELSALAATARASTSSWNTIRLTGSVWSARAGNGWSPYSIQWLKRLRPALFRQDLIALFDLLQQQRIKPLIALRFALAEARQAHELLGKGGVTGKVVLVRQRVVA